MKITITALSKKSPPQKPKAISLEEKVCYAIDCISCDAPNKEKALEFLRKVNDRLQQLPQATEKQRILLEKIKPVMDEYGTYHLGYSNDG